MNRNNTRVRRTLLAAAFLIACGCGNRAGGEAAPVVHRVAIDGFVYVPASLTVAVGDTVVWTNNDIVPHTVTVEEGAFDSRSIGAGESWTYVPVEEGTFPYVCDFHPSMTGTLVVRR